MLQLQTTTLSSQDIHLGLLTDTYTATADKEIFARLFLYGVAGNGTYTAWLTITNLGVGSPIKMYPLTAPSVSSGDTNIGFTTIPIPVKNADVVKCYILGLAGDTAVTTIITTWWDPGEPLLGTDGKALVSSNAQDLSGTLSVNTKNIAGQAAALNANNRLQVSLAAADVSGNLPADVKNFTVQPSNPTVGGYAAGQDPATLVLDVAASGHNVAGTIGQKINSAGGAADPLTNVVPGSYAAGTAGYAIGTYIDAKISSRSTLNAATVSYAGPVSTVGNVTLIMGADYNVTDGTDLNWSATTWPNLTGATITFDTNGMLADITGSVITPTGNQKVSVGITAAQTLAGKQGVGIFQVWATLSSGRAVVLVSGNLILLQKLS